MIIWIVVIGIAVLFEIITTDLVSIWIVCGGLVGLILALANLSLKVQIIGCVVVTLLTIILIRPIAKKYLRGNIVKTNIDRLIGKQVTLQKEITPFNKGEVTINGEVWNAISANQESIEKGSIVSIIAIDGNKLIVKR